MDQIFKRREEEILPKLQGFANEYALDSRHCDYPLDVLREIYFLSMQSTQIEANESYLLKLRVSTDNVSDCIVLRLSEHQSVRCYNFGVKYENVTCCNDQRLKCANEWNTKWKKGDVVFVQVESAEKSNCLKMSVWIKSNETYSKKLGVCCNDIAFPFDIAVDGWVDCMVIKL